MTTVVRLNVIVTACLWVSLGSVCQLPADDLVDRIQTFVTEDTVLVAHVDVDQLDVSVLAEYVGKVVPEVGRSDQFRKSVDRMDAYVRQFRRAGGHEIYCVLSLPDVTSGPVFVVPLGGDANREVLRNLLTRGPSQREAPQNGFGAEVLPGSLLIFGPTQARMRFRSGKPEVRPGLAEALAAAGDRPVRIAVVPSDDHRRALSEMAPSLPGPWSDFRLREFCSSLLWCSIAVELPPNPRLVVTLDTPDETSAIRLAEQIGEAIKLASETPIVRQKLLDRVDLVQLWHPTVRAAQVLIEVDDQNDAMKELVREVLVPPIAAARKAAARARRINQFRQLAIAMANYESANGHYPPPAIVDEQGKPLLSWRVSVLPFLEEGDLYDQFHLDEPWDSEHNRKLVTRMPGIFADDELELGREGCTTYVVPVGKGTVFDTQEGTKARDIVDGVSKTVLLVEVDPVQSVIWTKPEDWNVNMDEPLRGVRRSDRPVFIVARCDASVQAISNDIDPRLWKALLTKDAGDAAD